MWGSRGVFADPAVALTADQLRRARAGARRAAREARRSLRTARGQYRRYRAATDTRAYLDWPRWRAEYLRQYRQGSGGGPSTAEPLND
ncbi:hypothetical protein ACWEKT_29270 [Nocardia takedensis]